MKRERIRYNDLLNRFERYHKTTDKQGSSASSSRVDAATQTAWHDGQQLQCAVITQTEQLLREPFLSGVLLTKKSLAMVSEHLEMQLIVEG